MDPKRPDVRLDDAPDEEGVVTKRDRVKRSSRSLIEKFRTYFER